MRLARHRQFEKEFQKLPMHVKDAFEQRVRLFVENKFYPLLSNHPLGGEYQGLRSINVTGDFRALFEDHGELVIFKRIGTHSELYG